MTNSIFEKTNIRNIRLVKLCALWKQDPSSNWRCKIYYVVYWCIY